MADERDPGLVARYYLTFAIALILLIYGPIDRSWPAWIAIRIGYVFAIPIAALMLLNWIWKMLKPCKAAEERFERALYALTAGFFLGLAHHDGSAKNHHGNTGVAVTRDDIIEYGDDIVIPGPDKTRVGMDLLFAGIAFWHSVKGEEKEERRHY